MFLRVVVGCDEEHIIDKIIKGNDSFMAVMNMVEIRIPKFSLRSFVTWMRIEGLENVIEKVLEKANIKN